MAPFVNDTFTGADNTVLSAHTPDVGSAPAELQFRMWTTGGSTVGEIGSNMARADGTADASRGYRYPNDPGVSEYDILFDIVISATPNLAEAAWTVAGRATSTGTTNAAVDRYNASYLGNPTAGVRTWAINKWVSGTKTDLASFAEDLAPGTYQCKFEIRNAAKKLYVFSGGSWVEKCSTTDNTITQVGRVCVACPISTKGSIDNLSAEVVAAGGATVTPAAIATTVAAPATGKSAGSTISATTIASTALVASGELIEVGMTPMPIALSVDLYEPLTSPTVIAAPDSIDLVVAFPQAEVITGQEAQPESIPAMVAFPQATPLTETVITPGVITITTTVPQAALSATSSPIPGTISVVVAIPRVATSSTLIQWIFVTGPLGLDWTFIKGTSGESRKLWEYYGEQPRGKTVIRTGGTWATHAYPNHSDLEGADLIRFPDGTLDKAVLLGGHHTPVTTDIATELDAAGYGAFLVPEEIAA